MVLTKLIKILGPSRPERKRINWLTFSIILYYILYFYYWTIFPFNIAPYTHILNIIYRISLSNHLFVTRVRFRRRYKRMWAFLVIEMTELLYLSFYSTSSKITLNLLLTLAKYFDCFHLSSRWNILLGASLVPLAWIYHMTFAIILLNQLKSIWLDASASSSLDISNLI